MIAVEINATLFHLDVVLPARFSKDQRMQRYISSDLASVIDMLTSRFPTESRLSMQSKFIDGEPYQMREVSSIYKAISLDGSQVFVCHCDDDRIVIGADCNEEVTDTSRLIWPRASHLSWSSITGSPHQQT